MPNSCTVCMNNSGRNKDISFFSYPRNHEQRQEWLQVVGRQDLIEKLEDVKARRNYRICERHFETDCIKFSKNKTVKYLTDNAYPTLHLPSIPDDASTSTSQMYQNISASTSSSKYGGTTVINNQNSENIPLVVDTRKENTILSDPTSCSVQADLPDFANKMDGCESGSTQTALHLSADTPRKREIASELREAKKSKIVDLNSVTKEDFLKLCDKFLNKNMAQLVKCQIMGYSSNRNRTQVGREPTMPEVEKEFEVEIEIKKEATDDPLLFDHVQVKTEPAEEENVEEREEEPRQRFTEVLIKKEPDDSVQIEDYDVRTTTHLKQLMELDLE